MKRKLINIITKVIFILLFTYIFKLLIVDDRSILAPIKQENYTYLIILGITVLITFIVIQICKIKKLNIIEKIEKKEKIIIMAVFIILFILQIVILENIYFKANWDVAVIYETAERYATEGVFSNNFLHQEIDYFDIYPNNLFLTSIFGIIIKFVNLIEGIDAHKVIVLISIILVDVAGIITVKTIGNFTTKKIYKIVGAILFSVFIGLSPWFIIPYSDTYSIAFPISILYNYTKKNKKWYNYLLIGVFTYVGYLIKPTNVIISIAIVIVETYKILCMRRLRNRLLIRNIIITVIGAIIVILCNIGLERIIGYERDKEAAVSLYHYLMMGINQRTGGEYSPEDLENSININGYEERIQYNKEVFLERLTSLSLKEFCQFYTLKLMYFYNDGIFSWNIAGSFYKGAYEENTKMQEFFKKFYYRDGDTYHIFCNIMQAIWVSIIAIITISSFIKKNNYKETVLYLSLIGITLFITIFEARSRYLYLYLPLYVVLAILGIKEICYKCYKNITIILQKYYIFKKTFKSIDK